MAISGRIFRGASFDYNCNTVWDIDIWYLFIFDGIDAHVGLVRISERLGFMPQNKFAVRPTNTPRSFSSEGGML
jgi:hypothetical protein